MERVRLNRALNKEIKYYGLSYLGIIGATLVGCLVWTRFGMTIGIMGFVEGISKIFVRELKSLSVYERPIHCTDVKREKLYIKDEDKWEKEEDGKPKIVKAIKYITHHNIKVLPQWQKENPLYSDSRSKDNDMHNQIIIQIMSDEEKLYNKIITNVSKNVVIDKESV